jgi:hypothetical protein
VDFVQTSENFFSVFFGGTFTEHKTPWGIYEIKRLASTAISFSKMCHIVFLSLDNWWVPARYPLGIMGKKN